MPKPWRSALLCEALPGAAHIIARSIGYLLVLTGIPVYLVWRWGCCEAAMFDHVGIDARLMLSPIVRFNSSARPAHLRTA